MKTSKQANRQTINVLENKNVNPQWTRSHEESLKNRLEERSVERRNRSPTRAHERVGPHPECSALKRQRMGGTGRGFGGVLGGKDAV